MAYTFRYWKECGIETAWYYRANTASEWQGPFRTLRDAIKATRRASTDGNVPAY